MLQLKQNQAQVPSVPSRSLNPVIPPRSRRCRTLGEGSRTPRESIHPETSIDPKTLAPAQNSSSSPQLDLSLGAQSADVDPLYLFACRLQWETEEDASAGWELLAAAQSSHGDTRAHARALLSTSRNLGGVGSFGETAPSRKRTHEVEEEEEMRAPYGLEIIENCAECAVVTSGDFCAFSQPALAALSQFSQKSILPAGAILFVEGQAPRGIFIMCSGKINLSTTSREGKVLMLKTAGPGEALGLSANISGTNYETTAETATPCLVNFVERGHFLELIQNHCEIGMNTAHCLSQDYLSACRDIHDLVLTRSSAGKLARLLLSQAPREGVIEGRRRSIPLTHEEMAMRIGSSRETVTRLLSELRKRQLIHTDGPRLVIRDRTTLEAMAV